MHQALTWLARAGAAATSGLIIGCATFFLLAWHMMTRMATATRPEDLQSVGFGFYFMMLLFLPFAGFFAAMVHRAFHRVEERGVGGLAAMGAWAAVIVWLWMLTGRLSDVMEQLGLPLILALPLMLWGGRVAGGILAGHASAPAYFDPDGEVVAGEPPTGTVFWGLTAGFLTLVMLALASLLLAVGVVRTLPIIASYPVLFLIIGRVFAGWVGLRFIRSAAWQLPLKKVLGLGAGMVSLEAGGWMLLLVSNGMPLGKLTGELHWVLLLVACGSLGAWLGTLGPVATSEPTTDDGDFRIDFEGPADAPIGMDGLQMERRADSLTEADGPAASELDAGAPVGGCLDQMRSRPQPFAPPIKASADLASGSRADGPSRGGSPTPAIRSVEEGGDEDPPSDAVQKPRRRTSASDLADMYQTFDGKGQDGDGPAG